VLSRERHRDGDADDGNPVILQESRLILVFFEFKFCFSVGRLCIWLFCYFSCFSLGCPCLVSEPVQGIIPKMWPIMCWWNVKTYTVTESDPLCNWQMFSVLNDEIRRLSRVLEEFDRPFNADPVMLQLYKKVCVIDYWNFALCWRIYAYNCLHLSSLFIFIVSG